MTKSKFWNQLAIFIIALLAILSVREYFSHQLIEKGIDSYQTHTFLNIGANLLLILVSYYLIKQNGLTKISGIKGTQLKKWYLLIFPLVYLVLVNAIVMDDPNMNLLLPNIGLLVIYAISIGLSEELSIRGFLQSHFINEFGKTKKKYSFINFCFIIIFWFNPFNKF